MEKIIRYRNTQPLPLDEFIEKVLETPNCIYCQYYQDCCESAAGDIVELTGGEGCSLFDNTITGLKDIYLKQYALKNT